MMCMATPEITVIIATYNPDLSELKRTVKSVMLQRDVNFEIAITDDGSHSFPLEEIREFFKINGFEKFKIITNKENKGTVQNIFSGIINASGKYIKLISPGDCLASEMALQYLMDSIKKSKSDMVFGNIAYYVQSSNGFLIKKHKAHPQNVTPYQKQNSQSIWYNYLILDDTVHGLSTFCRKEVLYKYFEKALGKVIYSEDCLYRVMINDGVTISYCPETIAFYSYGGGISTSNDNKWKKLIKVDLEATDQMVADYITNPRKKRLFDLAIDWRDKKDFRSLMRISLSSPLFLFEKIKGRVIVRYTPDNDQYKDFYLKCCQNGE